jgi:hypothetical protein
MAFRLFDPRLRFDAKAGRRSRGPHLEPRIRSLDAAFDPLVPLFRASPPAAPAVEEESDGTVSAASLCRRLAAIKRALEDLPRQARRYARWRAKPFETRRPKLFSSLRPGAPPGFRESPRHRVEAILHECNWLARSLPATDTS